MSQQRTRHTFRAATLLSVLSLTLAVSIAGHTRAGKDTSEGTSPAGGSKVLRADTLKGLHDGKVMKASLIEVTIPPGVSVPPHRHPGSVTGYVLEGTLEFAVAEEPVRTLDKGDTFFEPKMILHRVARNPDNSRPCRFLVTMVHLADAKQLVIPEAASTEQDTKANDR